MNQLNLKKCRQQCAMKQDVMALKMNVTKSAISKLESKNSQDLSLKKLSDFVDALGGSLAVKVTLPDGTLYTLK